MTENQIEKNICPTKLAIEQMRAIGNAGVDGFSTGITGADISSIECDKGCDGAVSKPRRLFGVELTFMPPKEVCPRSQAEELTPLQTD